MVKVRLDVSLKNELLNEHGSKVKFIYEGLDFEKTSVFTIGLNNYIILNIIQRYISEKNNEVSECDFNEINNITLEAIEFNGVIYDPKKFIKEFVDYEYSFENRKLTKFKLKFKDSKGKCENTISKVAICKKSIHVDTIVDDFVGSDITTVSSTKEVK